MVSVAIVHQHTNNFGDDAAGVALAEQTVDFLGASSVDIFYIWHKSGRRLSTSDEALRHHMIPTLSGSSDRRLRLAVTAALWPASRSLSPDLATMVEICKKADFVFVAPAGSNLGIYRDWMYLFTLLILVREGVRPRFFQNTVAPSGSRIFDWLSTYVLRRSELFVREAASARWLATKKMSAYLGVDTALLLEPRPASKPAPSPDARYIAVVPTRLASWHPNFRTFDDQMFLETTLPSALVDLARERDLEIVVVPHLAGPEAEKALHATLLSALAAGGCRARVADVRSLNDYRDALAAAEAVVSMRYHGVILAAHAGVPCVSLSYENKMHEAAAYLGLAELELDVRDADIGSIRDRVSHALDNADAITPTVNRHVSELRTIALGPLLDARSSLLRS